MGDRVEGAARAVQLRYALGLTALGALLHLCWFHGLRHDDAFVTFRYARNLALGQGFTFNPGERVLGTTSPLFALLLAPVYAVGGDRIAQAAVAVSAAALGVQAWLLYLRLRDGLPLTALSVAGAVSFGLGDSASWLALETHLSLALGLASLALAERQRPGLAGLVLGLAFMTRHDSALWGPFVLLACQPSRRGKGPALRMSAAAGLVALGWLGFAFAYFGQPLPHTLGAKLHSTAPLPYLAHYLDVFSRLPGLVELPGPVRAACAGLAFASGVWGVLRSAPKFGPVLGFSLSLLAAYALLGPPARQHWHLYPATLGVRVVMLVGVCGPLERWARERRRRPWLALGVGALASVALCVALWQRSQSVPSERWLGERHRRYEQVGSYVNAHVPAGGRFMATEIGTLGYLTDRTMIDPFGLINWTNDWPRSGRPEDYMALVRHYRPELVLFDSPLAVQMLAAYAPELRYRVLKVFDWQFPFSTLAVLEPSGPR